MNMAVLQIVSEQWESYMLLNRFASQYVPTVGHTVKWQVPTVQGDVGICTMIQQQGDYVRVS